MSSEATDGGISKMEMDESPAKQEQVHIVDIAGDSSEDEVERSGGSSPEKSWRGVPIEAIHRGRRLFELEHLSPVAASNLHRVLYQNPIKEPPEHPPRPHKAPGKWDSEHVRLPCAPESKYPRQNEDGTTSIDSRWEMIERALLQPIESAAELQAAILSYNTTYRDQWNFRALHQLLDEELDESETRVFFEDLLPRIIRLALRLPDLVQAPVPLLKQHHNAALTLSQQQIACLLANAFLCTFPRRNTLKRKSEYSTFPDINFNRLYQSSGPAVLEKLKCIMHYFRRVCPTERDASNVPTGAVTFVRRSAKPENQVRWNESAAPLGAVPMHVDAEGTIEDEGVGLLQVDFANKYLGGGVLGHGCVQEEIRFVICPELLVGKLFTECLRPYEALVMLGAERYSNYTGYAGSFEWSGNHEDRTPRDSSRRRQTAIVAIDALHFAQATHQYRVDLMERELNKAHIGFVHWMATPPPGVATGNWGCGAFGGDPYLKSLLQLMVCAQLGRPLAYYTFGNVQLRDDIHDMWTLFRSEGTTVQQLWRILRSYSELVKGSRSKPTKKKLYQFIREQLGLGDDGAGSPSGDSEENVEVVTKSGEAEAEAEAGIKKPSEAEGSASGSKSPPERTKKQKQQSSLELFATQSSLENSNSSPDPTVALLLSDDEEANAMMMAASLEAKSEAGEQQNSTTNSGSNAGKSSTSNSSSSSKSGGGRQLTLLEMLDTHYEQGQATKRPRSTPSNSASKSRKENEEK
ncbi:hypothetical protein KR054_003406 [Drosophila jambulina]|nr:hypothetical protein KR054_003406 [Drosophila jambulina]